MYAVKGFAQIYIKFIITGLCHAVTFSMMCLSEKVWSILPIQVYIHWHILWKICNNVIIKYPTAP